MPFHRDSQKRFYGQDKIYFITIKTFENFPYFKEKIFCELFIEELRLTKELKKFYLYGFCVLYDHVHLIIQPNDEFNISKVMQFLKRHFSRSVNYILNFANEIDTHRIEGDIRECRLQGGDYEYLSKTIKNQDKFLKQLNNNFHQKCQNHHSFPKFQWQKSYRDHVLRNTKDWQNHYLYTVYNFNKHGLPPNWQYTSINYPELTEEMIT